MIRADLHKFSAGEGSFRVSISLPWSRGEWTYATNGHILVRVPRLADVDDNLMAPAAEKLLADAKQTEFIPVPECPHPPDVDCTFCNGTGKIRDGRKKYDCMECNGSGDVPCLDSMDVGDGRYAKRYLALIQGWEIAPNGMRKAAWIRNGDATGLLMPISR